MTIAMPPLPIDVVLPRLCEVLADQCRAVLVAPPGAGKTTRVPLALLDARWRNDGKIIVLEPRRLAARAAAAQMARLLGEDVGQTVGYRVRLESRVTQETRIEVVTEGIFTRMILDDPELNGVAAVLFDEFHERSLDADLGLALAIDAMAIREDLRVLVMSATIDGARIAKRLDNAPVIESEGRAFPVTTHHLGADPSLRIEEQVARTVRSVLGNETGSILVFLPGQGEIRRVASLLDTRLPRDTDVAPLYGQLTPLEQDKAIQPASPGRRKVVLATSIAETSLTIEGVRIVIDCGLARGPAYDPATGLTALTTRRVSNASADQRRGRAGRTEPGVCYRLWNQAQALVPFDTPEILSADLSSLVLDLADWGVDDPLQMAFLDSPPLPAWNEAKKLLVALEALDPDGRITTQGKSLARLPLHPRLAHMVLAAGTDGSTAADLAALLSEHGVGGTATDLETRLRTFRTDPSPRARDARTLARRWQALAKGSVNRAVDAGTASIGEHLARAFPDRVAQAAGASGRFRLANGRAAMLDQTDALAREPYLVVTDITGSAANGRIRAAASITRSEIEAVFASRIVTQTELNFDAASQSVRARRTRRLGALMLDEVNVPIPDPANAALALAEGVGRLGIDRLAWTREQKALRARASYLNQQLGEDWPALDDDTLGQTALEWLAPHIVGRTSLATISADDLSSALSGLLDWNQRKEIEALLPSHFDAPSGSRVPIDYDAENGPAIEIRVQELFGLNVHPAIGNGRIPLLVVLLSPARRPIQTTRDLPGFWRGSWKDVAKDLKGRYPRHPWPDDPASAPATSRAKPRGT